MYCVYGLNHTEVYMATHNSSGKKKAKFQLLLNRDSRSLFKFNTLSIPHYRFSISHQYLACAVFMFYCTILKQNKNKPRIRPKKRKQINSQWSILKCSFRSRNYIEIEKHEPYFEVSAIQASSVTLT